MDKGRLLGFAVCFLGSFTLVGSSDNKENEDVSSLFFSVLSKQIVSSEDLTSLEEKLSRIRKIQDIPARNSATKEIAKELKYLNKRQQFFDENHNQCMSIPNREESKITLPYAVLNAIDSYRAQMFEDTNDCKDEEFVCMNKKARSK